MQIYKGLCQYLYKAIPILDFYRRISSDNILTGRKGLTCMTLKNNTQIHLKPVLAMHDYVATFPEKVGKYTCEISVQKGAVEFMHEAYDIETGIWNDAPGKNDPEKLLIREGEVKKFEFTCGCHFGQPDSVMISNNSYIKPALFQCNFCKKQELAG